MKVGDRVRWHWGLGTASGTAAEAFGRRGSCKIKGSTIQRNGSAADPALLIRREDRDRALKLASEVERA